MCCLLYRSLACRPNNYPQKRHPAVEKETGQSSQIEVFNNTRHQKLLVWSEGHSNCRKKQIRAIWLFVPHYNTSLNLS
ncbi:hypothetical protein CMK12_07095 [Candidatus Poribacteria bacterium]|nr:hypothetical protein [Candidatus Poribacteria bacterium]